MRTPVALPIFLTLAFTQAAAAQGVSSVVRPAGTNFSVTTGIGSSASVTTHAPLPGTNTSNNATPIVGLFPYVPDDRRSKDKAAPGDTDLEQAKPAAAAPKPPPRSAYQESNAIGRERVESPHDAAFNADNVFNPKK